MTSIWVGSSNVAARLSTRGSVEHVLTLKMTYVALKWMEFKRPLVLDAAESVIGGRGGLRCKAQEGSQELGKDGQPGCEE